MTREAEGLATPRYPFEARGNRVYDAAGREVAVATRADPALRRRAWETADLIADALNAYLKPGVWATETTEATP